MKLVVDALQAALARHEFGEQQPFHGHEPGPQQFPVRLLDANDDERFVDDLEAQRQAVRPRVPEYAVRRFVCASPTPATNGRTRR